MIQDLLHLLSLCVHIGTIHLIRAEFPDQITAIPVQSAVGYEQIIITALFIILDIRPLDGIVSAAAEPLSVIFIDIVRLIPLRMDRIYGLLIQLQQENPRFIKVFEEYLDDLTTGINNLYIMCDGNVVVGGPVAKYLVPYQDKIRRMLVEKYSFDTDGSYFSFAQCTAEQADTCAALMFLGDFISNI